MNNWITRAFLLSIIAVCQTPTTHCNAQQAEANPQLRRVEISQVHMGVPFRIAIFAEDPLQGIYIFQAFQRIKDLNQIFSDYEDESEISQLARSYEVNVPQQTSKTLFDLLQESQKINKRSEGAFDITISPLVKLWREGRKNNTLPSSEARKKALQQVGFSNLKLNKKKQTVTFKQQGMQLDFGGIAKGYAVDEAVRILTEAGFKNVLVEAGGDLRVTGPPLDRESWNIGVAPLDAEAEPSQLLALNNLAVATSGDAFQYLEIDGKRYSHLVDSRTGKAVTTRSSVTIVAPTCTLADGLASAVSVLGPAKGIELIEKYKNVYGFVVYIENNKVKTVASKNWNRLLQVSTKDPASTKD
ncbi:FAD:protein FMN transferase [Planctomycetales bacterium 10988]|nr:FAD:protein FMN transferase [Planctomycetales bacterium 10988]